MSREVKKLNEYELLKRLDNEFPDVDFSVRDCAAKMIKEYVDDHFKHFGFYPYEVEVDGQVYSYSGYWEILEEMNND